MTGSNISVLNVVGLGTIPLSTPANDVNGNTATLHTMGFVAAGIATPVSPAKPMPVSDPQNASYSSWPVITPSAGPTPAAGTYTPPPDMRTLALNVTVAGNLSMTDGAGNIKIIPLSIGYQTLPYMPAMFTTTAVATFWADK